MSRGNNELLYQQIGKLLNTVISDIWEPKSDKAT